MPKSLFHVITLHIETPPLHQFFDAILEELGDLPGAALLLLAQPQSRNRQPARCFSNGSHLRPDRD